jgi:hypothetical protein
VCGLRALPPTNAVLETFDAGAPKRTAEAHRGGSFRVLCGAAACMEGALSRGRDRGVCAVVQPQMEKRMATHPLSPSPASQGGEVLTE